VKRPDLKLSASLLVCLFYIPLMRQFFKVVAAKDNI
jgi:hypothetical protein